jgi:hypothetical protein
MAAPTGNVIGEDLPHSQLLADVDSGIAQNDSQAQQGDPWAAFPTVQAPQSNMPSAPESQSDPWSGFETVEQPAYESHGLATNFAGQDDLEAYHRAKARGASEEEALSVGDNGVGSDYLGGIKTPNVYGAALPESVLRENLGDDPAAWRRARAEVWMNGQKRVVPIVDLGPGKGAQARGVTTDITAPLSNGLGGSGMDPVTTRILKEAGPDYTQDPDAWWKEQHQIEASMPGVSKWAAFPTVDEPDQPQSQTPSPQTIASDKAFLNPTAKPGLNVPDAAALARTAGTTEKPGPIVDAWNNILGSAGQAGFGLSVSGNTQRLNQLKSGEAVTQDFASQAQKEQEDRILADPNTSREEADDIIHQRNQRLQAQTADAQRDLAFAKKMQASSAAITPGDDYQKTIPGQVTKFIGESAPFLGSGLLGPVAPAAVAAQMAENQYGETYERDLRQGADAHPEWTADELQQHAHKSAEDAANGAAMTGLVVGLLPVPKLGGVITKMVSQIGIRGTYMTIAGAANDIQQNIAVNKIDPRQAILDGVLAHAPANFVAGGAFELAPAIGEAIGRHGTAPDSPKAQPEARPAPEPAAEQETQPQGQVQPQAQPINEERGAVVEENGELTETEANGSPGEIHEPAGSVPEAGLPEDSKAAPVASPDSQRGLPVDEAGRPTKRWADLLPEEQASFTQKVKDAYGLALAQAKPLFDALGVHRAAPDDPLNWHLAITPRSDGSITLEYNPDKLATTSWNGHFRSGDDALAPGRPEAMVREELIHAAYVSSVLKRWNGQGDFHSFLVKETQPIWEAVINVAKAAEARGDTATGKALRDALNASESLYSPGKATSSYLMSHEVIRQLVQLRENTPVTESFFQGHINRALSGIKNAYQKAHDALIGVRDRIGLVPELYRAVTDTEARLREIGAAKEQPAPLQAAIDAARGEGGTPIKATIPGESLFLPNREVVEKQPHTDELVRALDDYRAEEGELHGRLSMLNQRFKELSKKNPNLTKEVDRIGHIVADGGAIPPNISPEAREWLMIANNGEYREIADRMRAGGFKTVLPDGSTRPFIGAPQRVTPFPRIMRPDVADTLAKPIEDGKGNLTPAAQKLFQEGQNTINKNTGKPFFETPEDLKAYVREYNLAKRQGPLLSNLERARIVKFPSFFYTYSPEAMLGTLAQQGSEVARLNAFGQKLRGQSDLFDKTVEEINNDLTLRGAQKQHAVAAIDQLRNNVYGLNKRSALIRFARGISSASLAGSPHTSAKIGLGMLFNLPQYRGLGRTLEGVFKTAFRPGTSFNELRRLGLSSDQMTNLSDDPYAKSSAQQKATNIFTGVLRVAGHALAQDIGKSVTARASRAWLEGYAIPRLQVDPTLSRASTRMIAADINRRGLDPAAFSQKVVDPKVIDRFVREDVQDLQTAYRPEDYPGWASTQYGSVAFQFGHWSYNAARAILRDSVLPLAEAVRKGDSMLAGRYAVRLIGTGFAAAGAAEIWREIDKLFGRQSNVATVGEIMQAFAKDNPEAAHLLMNRVVQDIVGSSVVGGFGDVYNWVSAALQGSSDTSHFFNPAMPAAVGWGKIMVDFVEEGAQQRWKWSERQWANLRGQLVGLGQGYYDVANTLGAALPGHSEAMGRREASFVRSRLDLFYQNNPAWDKRMKGATFTGNVHTPYLQNLNEALLSGKVQDARTIINQLRTEQKLTPQQLATSLRESVNSHRPIPEGKVGQAFLLWSRETMTPDELARMNRINGLYSRTAQAAGVSVK